MAAIRRRGPKQYQARVRLKGHPEASKTFETRQDAEAWAEQLEKLHKEGLGAAAREAEKLTLSAALDRYAKEVTPDKKGAAPELGLIRRWKEKPLAALPLSQIRGKDLAAYRDMRLASGKSGNTIRLEFALISHLYEVARKDWGLETLQNPVQAVRKPRLSRGRERRLLPGEEDALLAYCKRTNNLRLEVTIILAIETAMRRGELAGLTWNAVNLKTRMVYLHDTKNGESRTVPLSTRAVAALESLSKEKDMPILGYLHPDTISSLFADTCKACDIEGLRFHDLRHEATSRLFEKGFAMMEVATITGHKSLSMLKRYTHLKPSSLLDRLG